VNFDEQSQEAREGVKSVLGGLSKIINAAIEVGKKLYFECMREEDAIEGQHNDGEILGYQEAKNDSGNDCEDSQGVSGADNFLKTTEEAKPEASFNIIAEDVYELCALDGTAPLSPALERAKKRVPKIMA